jgi:hypothetical protein
LRASFIGRTAATETRMELSTPLDMICRIVQRAREIDALVPASDIDPDEDEIDHDDMLAPLEDENNETVEVELLAVLEDLAEDQIVEVLALAMVGRGTYDASEWDEAIEIAGDPDEAPAVDQLMEMPMLAACLDAGLAAFDLSCDGIGQID